MEQQLIPQMTREEFRGDLQTIVLEAVTAAKHEIIHMVNEDFAATNRRIDNLSKRMDKRFRDVDARFGQMDERLEGMDEKVDFAHKLLHVHVANPSAHSRPSR